MGREDQKEEREVLDSIFPDEIQDISDTEFRISINLETTKESGDETEDPTIILNVRYPDEYPDEPPLLDITQPPNSAKHQYLDIQEDKARLLEALKPTIEENMGMAMVFSLVSTLKDSAELLMSERHQAVQAQRDLESQRAEEAENAKFEGEKVTKDSFLEWRGRFKKEMAEEAARKLAEQELEEKKKRGGKAVEEKLTGKQLWQQGLAKTGEEEEDGEDAIDEMRRLKVEG